jgi:exodeoxyribonuclease VII large subunit
LSVKPISVSQLNNYVKRVIGTDPILGNLSVTGEISNLVHHSSGHIYFALKDDASRLNCFLSIERKSNLHFELSAGMQIIAYGNLSVYEKNGSYSLNIREVDPAGEGALSIAFENLKNKLKKEGIFDTEHKKKLPLFPHKIALITSPTGAAVRDMISTIRRRNPMVDIIVYPCLVQGAEASKSIADTLQNVNAMENGVDLVILGRGGGSLEDLWAFNEEIVARAVYASRLPVISAVGHETDTVISDYAADVRAATPTAAAELAVPDIAAIKNHLQTMSPERTGKALHQKIGSLLVQSIHLKDRADSCLILKLSKAENELKMLGLEMENFNPLNVLKRGYAIVCNESGKWLISSRSVKAGDALTLIMNDGQLRCTVSKVEVTE